MSTQNPLSRRDALRLGVIGSAIALGHPVFVAQTRAQNEVPPDQTVPLWTLKVDIPGLPFLSANIHSIAIDDLRVDVSKRSQTPEGCVTIRAKGIPEVRKEVAAWFHAAHERKAPPTYVKILLAHRDGGTRTYNLVDAFPISYSTGDYTTSAEANLAELTVKPTRVEMA